MVERARSRRAPTGVRWHLLAASLIFAVSFPNLCCVHGEQRRQVSSTPQPANGQQANPNPVDDDDDDDDTTPGPQQQPVTSTVQPITQVGTGQCTTAAPCANGYGDCDANAECLGTLVCVASADGMLSGGGQTDYCGTAGSGSYVAKHAKKSKTNKGGKKGDKGKSDKKGKKNKSSKVKAPKKAKSPKAPKANRKAAKSNKTAKVRMYYELPFCTSAPMCVYIYTTDSRTGARWVLRPSLSGVLLFRLPFF